jgi:hypothetical protein
MEYRGNKPEPLRGIEAGSWAEQTMKVRLPVIARHVMEENALPEENNSRLQTLIDEMPTSWLRPLRDQDAPDYDAWKRYLEPYQGLNWLQAPWLFAEFYFYRRVLEATGYFEPGSTQGLDPYALHKQRGLLAGQEAARSYIKELDACLAAVQAEPSRRLESLLRLLRASLWGNQADLSIWPAGQESGLANNRPLSGGISHLLVDDTEIVAHYLVDGAKMPGQVHFILDNAAIELVHDLRLADFLLASRLAASVCLHFKAYPTYVSDATVPDFLATLTYLASFPEPECRAMAERMQDYSAEGRLQIKDNPFWNAPLSFYDAPTAFQKALGSENGSAPMLLISKGDANYRRFLGDLHWPFDTPLGAVLPAVPSPLLLLRIFKSNVAVGLPPELPRRLDQDDPGWALNGNWGVVQFHRRS